MLSKNFRLKRGQIKYLTKKATQSETGLFIIKAIANEEDHARFSVLISKKIFAKAVKRNHLRRQIYEAIRINLAELSPGGQDILLIPKKHIIEKNYSEIEKAVIEMLNSFRHG